MRLGIVLDRLRPEGGGAEAHTTALVRHAVAAGVEVVVALLEGEAPAGATVLPVPAPRRRPARDRALAALGPARLRDAGADVVLAIRHVPDCDVYLPHGGLVADSLHARDLARGGPRRLRTLARVLSPRVRFFVEAEAALLGAAEGPRVVAVSRQLRDRIAEVWPRAARRTVVVPNAADPERWDPARLAVPGRAERTRLGLRDAFVLLLAAHDPRLKGAAVAIEALARPEVRALTPAARLVLAGGRLPPDLARRARRLGVADRIVEVGPVEDLGPLLGAADVLVHPTWYDPCSLVCLEALAAGVPVITTPANGAREAMGARGGIVLERPGDPEALAVALRVLAEPALRRATGEDARTLALRHRMAGRLDALLDVCRAAAAARVG